MKRSAILSTVLCLVLLAACKQSSEPSNLAPQPAATSGPEKEWWKEAVVYQIYPRSFKAEPATANAGLDLSKAKVLIGNYQEPSVDGKLRAYEAVIFEI